MRVNYVINKQKNRLENDFTKVLNRAKAQGLDLVVDFLQTKARKSIKTSLVFYSSLEHLNSYVKDSLKENLQEIIPQIKSGKPDVYKLLNGFIDYLQNDSKNGPALTPKTIQLYLAAAKSFFVYYDIDISPAKFRYKVSLPTLYKEDEEAIDAADIKEILSRCGNRRLKAYLLTLASGGMRATEALAIRLCDIDLEASLKNNDKSEPAAVKIRKEYSKTKRERNIWISNEAARYVNDWLSWKYRNPKDKERDKDDLVFSYSGKHPSGLYPKIAVDFRKLLDTTAGFNSRKSDGVYKRRNITFHSFRRFVKTTIANQTRNDAYSEFFLGHAKSPYYVNKPQELRRIYKEDCMKYLTFLDYPTVEATGRSFEAQLKQKDKEIEELKRKVQELSQGTDQIEELKEKAKEYDSFMGQFKPTLEEFQREINSLKLQINSEDKDKDKKHKRI